jgi:hypothetical protein
MKHYRKVILSILILLLIFIGVLFLKSPNLDYVKKSHWRYEKGIKIGEGDFVDFENDTIFHLKNDTIFYNKKPKVIVKFTSKKFYLLVVKSIKTNEYGTYIDMNGHTEGFW